MNYAALLIQDILVIQLTLFELTGDDHTPKRFSTWGAKAIAIIGSLPDTLHDRSIVIQLRRKLSIEKTAKLRHADPNIFKDLQRKLLRFSNDSAKAIANSRPNFPENISISDRALDNWEPLLAIAKLAGHTWIEKVYQAAANLSESDKETLPIGTELLKDIEKIFADKSIIKIHTVNQINCLCEDEESPWSIYNFRGQDKKITPRQLVKLLSPYQISTKNIEIGGGQKKDLKSCNLKKYGNVTIIVFLLQPLKMPSVPSSRPENMRKTAEVDGWTAKYGG